MYGKFFGHFLRENRIITNSQLKSLLEMQRREHRPLGVMAIAFGYLSANQVQEIIHEQQESEKRFGELALEMGLLSEDQIDRLAQVQIEQHMLIGQLAVEQSLLDYPSLEQLLEKFHSENTRLEQDIQGAIEESKAPRIMETALWTVQRFFSRVFRGVVKGVERLEGPPKAGRLDMVLCLHLSCFEQGGFSQALVLRKPLVYSLIYCLLGRETSSERLIRDSLQELGWDVLKAEVNSLTRQGIQCVPQGVDILSKLPDMSGEPTSVLLDGPTGPFPLVLFGPV